MTTSIFKLSISLDIIPPKDYLYYFWHIKKKRKDYEIIDKNKANEEQKLHL